MRTFLLFIFFVCGSLGAKEKICLNMIVKNESRVIKRCLDSVKPFIDYWVIVDTGSNDGTQHIIKQHLKGIPGELIERPWKNFGYNRTEALELAKDKGDFLLIIDADDWLEFENGFEFPLLSCDSYNMWRGSSDFQYLIPQLIRAKLPWRWVGVLHEYLDCPQHFSSDTLKGVRYVSGSDGASSVDPEKFLKYVAILEEGLKEEPNNERYVFYLAEAYRDAGNSIKALEWYQKRVNLGGWDEEVFWSQFQVGKIMADLQVFSEIVIKQLYQAHCFRPHRAEPLYYLAELYNKENKYAMAYETIKAYQITPKPSTKDTLFNMVWIEEYGLGLQLSIASYYLGLYKESLEVCNQLLAKKNLPESWRKQIECNRAFALEKTMANPQLP